MITRSELPRIIEIATRLGEVEDNRQVLEKAAESVQDDRAIGVTATIVGAGWKYSFDLNVYAESFLAWFEHELDREQARLENALAHLGGPINA